MIFEGVYNHSILLPRSAYFEEKMYNQSCNEALRKGKKCTFVAFSSGRIRISFKCCLLFEQLYW